MARFRNAARGLRLKGTDFIYLTEGAYGVVFVDRQQGRIRKVYRVRTAGEIDHCREVFEAETEAYKIASNTTELKNLVPVYFGVCSRQVVIDADAKDISNEFYCDLAFEAEFVDCNFEKLAVASKDEERRVVSAFRVHGIRHLTDMSVCLRDGRITKVIDFATKEVELWHEDPASSVK